MRARIWAWARPVAGLAIIAVLVWRLGTGAFLAGLRVVDGPVLLAGLGIGLVTTALSAWRWCLVARGLGVRLPLRGAIADYYRSLFLNAALPGGVLGDVHRAVRHGRDVGNVGDGVRAVVLERMAGQVALAVVGVAVLIAAPLPIPFRLAVGSLPTPAVAGLAGVGLVVCVVAAVRARRRTSRVRRAVRSAAGDVRRGLLARRTGPWIALTSVAVLAGHLATFLVAARAVGATAPVTTLVPLMVLALLAMALPLNVGGWGPREGACAWAFGVAGLGAAQGLTVAVVYGLLAFVASLPGAGVLVAQWMARLPMIQPGLIRLRLLPTPVPVEPRPAPA